MVRLLTDNDFNGRATRGLLRKRPGLDLVRVQDVGLATATDQEILAWAAANDRVVVTHDRNTMVGYALDRVAAGEPMPGVLAVALTAPVRRMVDDILLVDACSQHAEWANRVEYLPY